MTYQLPKHGFAGMFTQAQLLEAYQAGQRDMREAAAGVCEKTYSNGDGIEAWFDTIAARIRALPLETL